MRYEVVGHARERPYATQAQLHWEHQAGVYEARLTTAGPGATARFQVSTGRTGALGLVPSRFAARSGREQAAHFDAPRGRVVFSGNTPDAALGAGAQDPLSVYFQLAAMFSGDAARYPAGTSIAIQTVGVREAEQWVFTVEGEYELCEAHSRPLRAVLLVRAPRREYDPKIEVWMASDWGYLPARLRITQANGNFSDMRTCEIGQP